MIIKVKNEKGYILFIYNSRRKIYYDKLCKESVIFFYGNIWGNHKIIKFSEFLKLY